MNKKPRGAWPVAMVFVGTVIGAGFASGAEIMAYFTRYGEAGFLGMMAAGVLFFAGMYGTLKIAYEQQSTDYGHFTERIAGKWAGALLEALVMFSMLLGYGVMLSGTGAIFRQQWNLPESVGMLLMAAAVYIALRAGREGILKVCQVLTPILIAGAFLLGVYSLLSHFRVLETAGLALQPLSLFSALPMKNWPQALGSAVLYASYNMLGAAAVLVGVSGKIKNRAEIGRAAWLGAGILVALTLSLGVATFLNYDTIQGVSIPALALLEEHAFWQQLYVGVLLGAMYTTALSDGFGIMGRLQGVKMGRGMQCLLMTVLSLGLARLGFAQLVAKGYRLLGVLGMGQLLLTIVHSVDIKGDINEKRRR